MSMKPILILAIVGSMALVAGCSKPAPNLTADTIYTGGDIVTVNDAQPAVEALALKDGKILAVGTRAEIERAHKGRATTSVDLAGKTLGPPSWTRTATTSTPSRWPIRSTCLRLRPDPARMLRPSSPN